MKGKVISMQQTEPTQILSKNSKLISKKGNNVMKNIKRILALVIVATMLVAIAIIPASAAEARRKPECDCGGKTALIRTINGTWTSAGSTRSCIHFTYGQDVYQKRTVTRQYKCESCGEDQLYSYTTEYRWYCNGHA